MHCIHFLFLSFNNSWNHHIFDTREYCANIHFGVRRQILMGDCFYLLTFQLCYKSYSGLKSQKLIAGQVQMVSNDRIEPNTFSVIFLITLSNYCPIKNHKICSFSQRGVDNLPSIDTLNLTFFFFFIVRTTFDLPFRETRVSQTAFGMCCCTSAMCQMIRATPHRASKKRPVKIDYKLQ